MKYFLLSLLLLFYCVGTVARSQTITQTIRRIPNCKSMTECSRSLSSGACSIYYRYKKCDDDIGFGHAHCTNGVDGQEDCYCQCDGNGFIFTYYNSLDGQFVMYSTHCEGCMLDPE